MITDKIKSIITVVTAVAGTIAIIKFFDERKTKKMEGDIRKLDYELKKHEYEQKLGQKAAQFLGFDGTYLY